MNKQSHQEFSLKIASLIAIILCSAHVAYGQDAHIVNRGVLSNFFLDSYKNQIAEIVDNTRETSYGAQGYIQMEGHIKLKTNLTFPNDNVDRARIIAYTFLKELSGTLGISNLNELREPRDQGKMVRRPGESIAITYYRDAGGLPYEPSCAGPPYFHIIVGPDGSIVRFDALLVAISPEVHTALTMSMVTREEAAKVVEGEIKSHATVYTEVPVSDIRKYYRLNSPYVVWFVPVHNGNKTEGIYSVNAMTGTFIKKEKSLRCDE